MSDFADLRPELATPDHQRPRKSEPLGTPQLKAEIKLKLEVEQSVDLIAYFNRLDAREQERYRNLDLATEGHSEWERPIVFLMPDEDEFDIDPWPFIPEVTTWSWVDWDEGDIWVRHRTGSTERYYGYVESAWSPDDFQALRDNVPWLDQVHREIEEQVPEVVETDLSRVPGPLDIPLDLEGDR